MTTFAKISGIKNNGWRRGYGKGGMQVSERKKIQRGDVI
jgi:hypothetical protein